MVACRERTGFDTVLVERVRVAQLEALDLHDEAVRDLDARIDETLDAIDSIDEARA